MAAEHEDFGFWTLGKNSRENVQPAPLRNVDVQQDDVRPQPHDLVDSPQAVNHAAEELNGRAPPEPAFQ